METIEHRRKLYNGFGDALARAVEFVAIPLLFGWVGHLLDTHFDRAPLFLLVLGVMGLVGVFMSAWYRYVEAMKAEEERAPWHKQ